MGIDRIIIKSCKSISKFDLYLGKNNFFLGENESGKTNILKSIQFFYDNLTEDKYDSSFYDSENSYLKNLSITIWYDISEIRKRSLSNMNPSGRFYNFFKQVVNLPFDSRGNKSIIKLQLSQSTTKRIQWRILSSYEMQNKEQLYQIRKMIARLFPLYYVDTRRIDLHDWNELWDAIGGLVSITTKENQRLMEQMPVNIAQQAECMHEIEKLKKLLDSSELRLYNYRIDEYRKILAKLGLKGDIFNYKDTPLTYRSDGQNSYNYLISLMKIVSLIADRKTRTPIIIIDEPELSWHARYVDTFSRELEELPDNMTLMVSTHSPRLVKNMLLVDREDYQFFQCRKVGLYTHVNLLRSLTGEDDKVKARLTDGLVNGYFTKMFVILEGSTELELFRNQSLKYIFPKLHDVEFVEGNANESDLAIVHPIRRGLVTPYLSVIDMDKIIHPIYDASNKKGSIDSKLKELIYKGTAGYEYKGQDQIQKNTSQRGSVQYTYGQSRRKKLDAKKDIDRSLSSAYSFSPFWGTHSDTEWPKLISQIKDYTLAHNIFVFSTTVEGALINDNNIDLVRHYYKKVKGEKKARGLQKIFDNYPNDAVSIMRLCFDGKPDSLIKRSHLREVLKSDVTYQKLWNEFSPVQWRDKTNWVGAFLDYYFGVYLLELYQQQGNHISVNSRWHRHSNYVNFCRRKFKEHFPEIYILIEKCTERLDMV